MTEKAVALDIRELQVCYPGSKQIVLDIPQLRIEAGSFTAVVGPSGAGKSTLLRALNGLVKPSRGGVRVLGGSAEQLTLLRRQVSMVFQGFNLMPRLSVLSNVLVGRLSHKSGLAKFGAYFTVEDREVALRALSQVGMLRYAYRDVRDLSGGQKQRVAIARCLAQQASIILADEPVASLDPLNARNVMALLHSLNQEHGITVVVNLHQAELVEAYCNSVVGLKAGHLMFHQVMAKSHGNDSSWKQIYA
ncbi:phosphonate ABC transporter ATP-binding protein [Pseudomonas sp. 2FE]|uniref:phosphonate ABC transporter ATP-binding protein n=1 Tax=Pseudomonas sp. 2FE TaxID=2502190 RepID=UPI0010F557BB|nr:ATP-binding cassette domain-containing protein [Pseudomonas sp. 2FE]